MKLELKHLAPYLPYGLKVRRMSDHNSPINNFTLQGLSTNGCYGSEDITPWEFEKCKPILRPLSELNREDVSVGDNKYEGYFHFLEETYLNHTEGIEHLKRIANEDSRWMYSINLYLYQHLLEWHFDVFGLIDEGLAIDVNTLNQNK